MAAPEPAPEPSHAATRGAGSYGVEPDAPSSRLEARALEAARAAISIHGGAPAASPALTLAARELAERAANGDPDPLAGPSLRSALSRAAASDPAPHSLVVRTAPADLVAALATRVPHARATHAGVGVTVRGDTAWAVLLTSVRAVVLDPFPRDVRAGAEQVLSGKLGPGLRWPRVFVTLPGGTVSEVTSTGERAFKARVAFPERGRYMVEVVGDAGGNPEVVALLAVSSGGAPLDAPVAAETGARPAEDDDARAADEVVRTINLTRGRQGLAPVRLTGPLSEVARAHSEVMLAARKVAHVLPGSGELGDRLRRGRIPFARAYENVGRARSALEAHQGAEESPAHLANILRPGVRQVGIGIARGRLDVTGDTSAYLTEIFVEPTDPGAESPLTPDARVREVLWRVRSGSAAPPLTADPRLDDIARDAAAAMRRSDDTEPGDLSERALGFDRAVAAVDVFVASGPEAAARSKNVRNARFRRVGVGVATGDSARYGAGRLWIAVVYTD